MRTFLSAAGSFIAKNLFVVVPVFLLLLGSGLFRGYFSHHSVWAPRYQFQHGAKLYGSFTLETVAQVEKLLSVLPRRVAGSIDSIKLHDDKEHYGYGTVAHFNGMCGGRRICLRSNSINCLWHEAGHAYESYLDSQDCDFTKEWRSVAGNVYEYRNVNKIIFPGNGLLTLYSSKNHREDVAEFVEAFYCAISGEPSALRVLYAASLKDFADGKPWRSDPRYQKKIDLLLKYGFVSRADYDRFMDLGYLDAQSGSPLAHLVLPKPKNKVSSRGIF